MKALAVDPGGDFTGVVVRVGRTLLDHRLVRRKDHDGQHAYLSAVVQCVDQFDFDHAPDVIAVEDVIEPNPHLGYTNVKGILSTARVIGALEHTFPAVRLVRPGGHGKTPDLPKGPKRDAYMREHFPAALLPEKDGTAYDDQLKHCRSAWDVGGAVQSVQGRFGITS